MSKALTTTAPQSLESLIEDATPLQRNFLILKAMGSDDSEAKRIADVSQRTLQYWQDDERFLSISAAVAIGDHKAEAIEMFLDHNLPSVLGELLLICTSGKNGERPHKDKERAIEFYLKDLCGISKHTDKSMSIAKILLEVQDNDSFPKEEFSAPSRGKYAT